MTDEACAPEGGFDLGREMFRRANLVKKENRMEVKAELEYFAFFHGYIVTANKDGSIPLNAKVVCQADGLVDEKLMQMLLDQANHHASEWKIS